MYAKQQNIADKIILYLKIKNSSAVKIIKIPNFVK